MAEPYWERERFRVGPPANWPEPAAWEQGFDLADAGGEPPAARAPGSRRPTAPSSNDHGWSGKDVIAQTQPPRLEPAPDDGDDLVGFQPPPEASEPFDATLVGLGGEPDAVESADRRPDEEIGPDVTGAESP